MEWAIPHHVSFYNGKAVLMDYITERKKEFNFAGMRAVTNAPEGHIITPKGEVYHVSRAFKRAHPVKGEQAKAIKARALELLNS